MTSLALQAPLPKLSSPKRSLILLAPPNSRIPGRQVDARSDTYLYDRLLAKMQRFRGDIYLGDGALRRCDLECDGRHCVEADFHSWHVLAMDGNGDVCGCSRYRIYPSDVPFSDLAVGRSALARSSVWQAELRAAVGKERELALRRRGDFVELGGWAISAELRRTTEALRIALATYALADFLGGSVGLTTATLRHHSALVLRKIGGTPLMSGDTEFPRYFDPEYECEMEILKFDSLTPNPRFATWIEQMRLQLDTAEVVTPAAQAQPAKAMHAVAGAGAHTASSAWVDRSRAFPNATRSR